MHKKAFKHTRLFFKDNILFDIPSDAFDITKVKYWQEEVLKLAEGFDSWLIISIPDCSLGITQEGADLLVQSYKRFKDNACEGVAILSNTVSAKILVNALSLN